MQAFSIIAGNHDLALHKNWYEMHYTRFHGKSNKQVRIAIFSLSCYPLLLVLIPYSLSVPIIQDYDAIHDLLTGAKARKSGIVYLEDESYTLQTKEGGREWSVYGSPVTRFIDTWRRRS